MFVYMSVALFWLKDNIAKHLQLSIIVRISLVLDKRELAFHIQTQVISRIADAITCLRSGGI